MQLPIFVRSPWYRLSVAIALMIVLAAAFGDLIQRPIAGGFGGIVGGLIVPVLREWPLLRLSRDDRRAALEAVHTGHATGRPKADEAAVDRLSTAAMYRPSSTGNRIAQLIVLLVICGIVLAASTVRSPWWLFTFVLVALLLGPLVLRQRPVVPADERLDRLVSEMNADTAEIE